MVTLNLDLSDPGARVPKAVEAMKKEMDQLEKVGVWNLKGVEEAADVRNRAAVRIVHYPHAVWSQVQRAT